MYRKISVGQHIILIALMMVHEFAESWKL